jgi:hypothetical protein
MSMENKANLGENGLEQDNRPGLCQNPSAATLGIELRCSGLERFWPPDPLTRMLMEADGVTETALFGLLHRIVLARGKQ